MKQQRTADTTISLPGVTETSTTSVATDLSLQAGMTGSRATETPFLDAVDPDGGLREATEACLVVAAKTGEIPGDLVDAFDRAVTELVLAQDMDTIPLRITATVLAPWTEEGRALRDGAKAAADEAAANTPEGQVPAKGTDWTRGLETLLIAWQERSGATPGLVTAVAIGLMGSQDVGADMNKVFAGLKPRFTFGGAYKMTEKIAACAGQLPDVWPTFIADLDGEKLVTERVFEAIPPAFHPQLLARVLNEADLFARLLGKPELVLMVLASLSPSDPGYTRLVSAAVERDASRVPRSMFEPWLAGSSALTVAGWSEASLDGLITAVTAADAIAYSFVRDVLDARAAGATEVGTFEVLMPKRFGIRLDAMRTKAGVVKWDDAIVLRHIWSALGQLPSGHVAESDAIDVLRKDKATAKHAGGAMGQIRADAPTQMLLHYADKNPTEELVGHIKEAGAVGPLKGRNALNHVVRHEVGHSVDNALGIMDQNGRQATFGGWEHHASDEAAFAAMLTQAKSDVSADALAAAAEAGKAAVEALGSDDVVAAAAGAVDAGAGLWQQDAPETEVGDRVFQRNAADDWFSYDADARTRKVSNYQFKTPGEWFAEVYATYYADRETGDADGTILAGQDATMADWIRDNVDGATVQTGR